MTFLISLIKENLTSGIKYIFYIIIFIILVSLIRKANNFINTVNSLKEKNILLQNRVKEQTEQIKNQEILISNYKKIFQKQALIHAKLGKIHMVTSEKFNAMDVEKINKLLNCHIDNFKNLDILCD